MQEELRAITSHIHVGISSLVLCPHISFCAVSFQFCAEFPKLTENKTKQSELSTLQMNVKMSVECSVTIYYSWKVFLCMCLLERCPAV